MVSTLDTIISQNSTVERLEHPFFPALALEIGLREGIILDTSKVEKITKLLSRQMTCGNLKWSDEYPFDYDSTITARNVLDMVGVKQTSNLDLRFSENGLLYTYMGEKKSKSNNSVDLLVNLRVYDYLLRKGKKEESEKLRKALQKQNFREDIRSISKYYLSNGFLLYSLKPVAHSIGANIESLANQIKTELMGKTDLGLLLLASSININEKYENRKRKLLDLFHHPRLEKCFSCEFFDEVVEISVKQKLKNTNLFDKVTAQIYDRIAPIMYDYETSANNLISLMNTLKISNEVPLIELAVGTGNFLKHMAKQGYSILGVDCSEDMLDKAKAKCRNYGDVCFEKQNVEQLDLFTRTNAIYTQNFIDVDPNENIQFWANTKLQTTQILNSIVKHIMKGGYLFIPKKQNKRTDGTFKLQVETSKIQDGIGNTYFYQDRNITLRRTYKKVVYSNEEFRCITKKLGLDKVQETNHWIAYKKT